MSGSRLTGISGVAASPIDVALAPWAVKNRNQSSLPLAFCAYSAAGSRSPFWSKPLLLSAKREPSLCAPAAFVQFAPSDEVARPSRALKSLPRTPS